MASRSGRFAAITAVILSALLTGCDAQTDACGHDISGYRSMLVALDPGTGAVRWKRSVPADRGWLIAETDSAIRVPTEAADRDPLIDVRSGKSVGSAEHRTATDLSAQSNTSPPPAPNSPDWSVKSGDITVTVGMITVDGSEMTATRGDETLWRRQLIDAGNRSLTRSRPLLHGDTVLITVGRNLPTCI